MPDPQGFLTINEAAEFLKVSKTSLRRWTANGKLPCYRVGHRNERRFRLDHLLAFVRSSPGAEILHPNPLTTPAAESLTTAMREELPQHVCLNFKTVEQQWRLLAPYLLSHLRPGTATVYLYDGEDGEARVHAWLRSEGLDAASLISQGLLRLIPASKSYLRHGSFDSARMLRFWETEIARARKKNTTRLLLTGEMSWATRGAPGYEQLLSYEAQLDAPLRRLPGVTIVCQYSLEAFPAVTIFESLCLHPRIQLPDRLVAGLGSVDAVAI